MKYFIIPGVLLLIFSSLNLTAQWVQVSNGIGNQYISSLAANINTIFAGTNVNGVYLSTNEGSAWIQTSLNNRTVASLAANENYVFAGTSPSTGLYTSSNNGTSWTQTGFISNGIYVLAANGNNVFAYYSYYPPHPCAFGVSRSLNNGATWSSSLFCIMVSSFAINGNIALAGGGGVLLSTDIGTNWTQAGLRNRGVYSLAINGNNIFAGTNSYGVYLTTINDTNWTQTSLNNQTVRSLAINSNNIFAGTSGSGVYTTNNNGANWTQKNEGLGNLYVHALCIFNNYIFAGTESSIYRRSLSELTGLKQISSEVPDKFLLWQNYPNPFNPVTKIKFDIPSVGQRHAFDLQLVIYDVLGREITTLVNEQLSPGIYEVEWDGTNDPSGIYYYKITAGGFTETKKMVLIK